MAKGADLGFVCYISTPERGAVPVNELTPDEEAQWHQNMIGRLGESMSDFYTQHPAEYSKLRK